LVHLGDSVVSDLSHFAQYLPTFLLFLFHSLIRPNLMLSSCRLTLAVAKRLFLVFDDFELHFLLPSLVYNK
jgi:hypothetical protein